MVFILAMSLDAQYAIVEFFYPDNSSDTAIVCTSWLIGRDESFWPKVSQARMLKMLREQEECDENSPSFPCRLLGTAGMYMQKN